MKAQRTTSADPRAPPGVPLRALVISLLALGVPVTSSLMVPGIAGQDFGMVVWLCALVPPFLLTYYRSWRGASVALAAGMAALSVTHLTLTVRNADPPSLTLLLVATSILIAVSLGAGWLSDNLHGARAQAESIARTDPLTGLANRRHLSMFLESAFSAAEGGMSISVVLFDLDGFKGVNDEQGHAEGDRVLAGFGSLLGSRTRHSNLSGRWGGEEFLTVLVGTDAEGASRFAERIRTELADRDFGWGRVTVSAGVAEYEASMSTPDLLVAAADQLLYRAKEEGRDRVAVRSGGHRPSGDAERPSHGSASPIDGRAGPSTESDEAPPRGRGETVLVVDDDPDARRSVSRVLSRLGYRVVEAGSPSQALAMVRGADEPVDLVVADVIMPTMSGFRLVEILLREIRDLRVVYISGYSQDGIDWAGAPGLVRTFLGKPMSIGDLARATRRVLDHPADTGPTVIVTAAAGGRPGGPGARDADSPPLPGRWTDAPPVPTVPAELADATILAVHRDADHLRALILLLGRCGFRNVRGTTDPGDLPVVLDRFAPDLILVGLDANASGAALIASLEDSRTEVIRPVVAVTGSDGTDVRRLALESGATEVIREPLDPWELEARLRNLLRLRTAQRGLAARTADPEGIR